MREQKQQRFYDLLNAEPKPKYRLSTVYKVKKNLFYRKLVFMEREK